MILDSGQKEGKINEDKFEDKSFLKEKKNESDEEEEEERELDGSYNKKRSSFNNLWNILKRKKDDKKPKRGREENIFRFYIVINK